MDELHALGWLPDPPKKPDEKPDWVATGSDMLASGDLPGSVWMRSEFGQPFHQGRLGSCTSQTVAKAIQVAHRRLFGDRDPEPISRLALYYLARASHGNELADTGTHIRTNIRMLGIFGFCPESLWPYDDFKGPDAPYTQMPPTESFRKSYDQSGKGGKPAVYRRITETGDARLDAVRRANAAGNAVLFGTDVSKSFANKNIPLPDYPVPPPIGEPIAGGHAMLLGGYEEEEWFWGYNSWGPMFGDNGWFKMSPEYVAWERTRDLWILDVVPSFR